VDRQDRQKKETEAYNEPRYHGTCGKIFVFSNCLQNLQQKQRGVILNRKGEF
jgi:hypothetical protein